ncbi:lysozyme inhibitor LprI family protein [Methylophaga sp.]|uniref:lysozyme inhibitor LprI family protein n=1 Tax=Methylophaga sp. TaxID=2024840 RepID=UPI0027251364|nr:lysozyme inhibitor LprI family protein [Methylophaga sp.]MDO8825661.1 lysozyme inhibitor LprI family protein [Methylophaga sp.]
MRKLVFFLLFVSTPVLAADNCPEANNTYELGVCLAEQLEQREVELQHYLAEARARYKANEQIVESIEKAQQSWLVYRLDQCSSIYDIWSDGTIRSIMGLNCSIRMTQLRTHQIWHSYLTYMDNSPPLLPEPQIDG